MDGRNRGDSFDVIHSWDSPFNLDTDGLSLHLPDIHVAHWSREGAGSGSCTPEQQVMTSRSN